MLRAHVRVPARVAESRPRSFERARHPRRAGGSSAVNGVEVYALSATRTRAAVERFVERFGPAGRPAVDAFPYPQFDPLPVRSFGSPGPLLDFLEATPDAEYSVYWPAVRASAWPRPLMAFFGADGALVLGAVVDPARVPGTLLAFAEEFGARFGRVDTLLPPESSAAGFVAGCRAAEGPRLIDGALVDG